MEMFINSSYLITIGTLIGYERTMRCKERTGKEDKEEFRQIPFCTGICCVQTYRKIEKAVLEVKVPIYVQLLDKLGYQMNYDDVKYKDINYRLRNLNDAIEKYDLDSVFLIIEKLNEVIVGNNNDIYYIYLRRILHVIYQYYKCNEFPSAEDVLMMKTVFVGYPIYLRDVMIDILFKYGLLNIIDDKKFDVFVEELNLSKNKFIPNQINDLQFLSYSLDLDNFYKKAENLLTLLENKGIYLRTLDIYDLKIYANSHGNPLALSKDIEVCQKNVSKLMEKLMINEDSIEKIPLMIRKKLSQHYYYMGYILYMKASYKSASECLEKAIDFDDIFDVLCNNLLLSCYDHIGYEEIRYTPYLKIKKSYEKDNKNYIVFLYFKFKFENSNPRVRLKYLKSNVLDFVFPDDLVLRKILFFELNNLAKITSNYQILQEFIEKMGIVN